jgi:hypothetical protein
VILFLKLEEISNKLLHDTCARKVECRYKLAHNHARRVKESKDSEENFMIIIRASPIGECYIKEPNG